MISPFFRFVRRVGSKPFGVILFRIRQAVTIALWHHLSLWYVASKHAERSVSKLSAQSVELCLFHARPIDLSARQRDSLKSAAEQALLSQFKLFDCQVPNLDRCDFSADWRFSHRWAPQYFKRYKFYVDKDVPYDVKFPWELSRLHYLVPVLAWQVVDVADERVLTWVFSLLRRWRKENVLAYSVNWYPMEASMRAINLVMLLDLVKELRLTSRDQSISSLLGGLNRLLLIMLKEHGHFIWLNREYTDVRGNHFTANLVALQLIDAALSVDGLSRSRWRQYANARVEQEVLLQFCDDGVNFEKSCGYHKLVLELFLISAVARTKAGKSLRPIVRDRLISAARFSDAISRPDGVAAGFGDSDDAVALPFLVDNSRSQGLVVELARAFFNVEIGSYRYDEREQLAALFLTGAVAQNTASADGPQLISFPSGGYVIVRNSSNGFFFMVDAGEVGMAGRGGHGHNDLQAFELCIDGMPIIVDPGCSGYTADLVKKTLFRSTAYHSTVQLYDAEMARFAGHWAIHNDAIPDEVSVEATATGAIVRVGHHGYARLHPGAYVLRTFDVDAVGQRVRVRDEVKTTVEGTSICWHFPSGELVPCVTQKSIAFQHLSKRSVSLTGMVPFEVSRAPFSQGYGHEVNGHVVVAKSTVDSGRHVYQFDIGLVNEAVA